MARSPAAARPAAGRRAAPVPAAQARGALARLHDPGALAAHPLAAAAGGGRGLRRALEEVLDALKPSGEGRPPPQVGRRHELLRLRYVEGLAVEEVRRRLLIGHAEYYREHEVAVEAVATLLSERLNLPPTAPPAPAREPGGALPVYLTSFVGREVECAEIAGLLGETRLLTLTGSGGCGKTRLAVQVAAGLGSAYPGGVRFIDLAPLADGALVPQAVLGALGLREAPGRTPAAAVAAHLRGRAALLVLDNCEHVVAACASLAEALLGACPGLRVLATSRETLGVAGETVRRVPSLATPEPGEPPAIERLAASPAVRLFADRAAAAASAFALSEATGDAVARICRRLDGIPLAIEMAAARARVLSVEGIAARLDERFRLLVGSSRSAPTRQQTLRAAFDWSYGLLTESERTLLRRLGVFAGGWSLEAAEAVCPGPGRDEAGPERGSMSIEAGDVLDRLSALVDKSLVVAELQASPERYRLLETVRAYALERLAEAGEAAAVRARHAAYFRELAGRLRRELAGGDATAGLARLDAELDNLRGALRWYADAADAEAGLRLVCDLDLYWHRRGRSLEGSDWIEAFLRMPGADAAPPSVLIEALLWASRYPASLRPGAPARSLELSRRAHALARAAGEPRPRARVATELGIRHGARGDAAESRRYLSESEALYRELGEQDLADLERGRTGLAALAEGDLAGARALFGVRLAAARRLNDVREAGSSTEWLGNVALVADDPACAARLFEDALELHGRAGDRVGATNALLGLGLCAVARGDAAGARSLLRSCLLELREIGNLGSLMWLPFALEGMAGVAALEGRADRALVLAGAAEATRETAGRALWPLFARQVEGWLAPARAALAPEAAAAAWGEGLATSADQAIAYALGDEPMSHALADGTPTAPVAGAAGLLSPREREVAALIARGYTNRRIAAALVVAETTAERHVANILAKLGAHARSQVAAWAATHLPPADAAGR